MDFCRYVTWQVLVFGFFCIFVQPVWRRWALSQPNLLLAMAFSTRQPPILQYPETSHAASVFAFAVPDGATGRERRELEKTQDADLHMPIQHTKVYTQKSHDSFCCVEFLKQFKANHRQSTLRIKTLGVPAHYTKRIHQWAFCLENMRSTKMFLPSQSLPIGPYQSGSLASPWCHRPGDMTQCP